VCNAAAAINPRQSHLLVGPSDSAIMELTVKRFANQAAMGALGVAAGALALYVFMAWGARHTPTGGIDSVHAALTMISVAVPIAAVVAVHVVYARVLFRYAKEG
jgi:hypothetical protein